MGGTQVLEMYTTLQRKKNQKMEIKQDFVSIIIKVWYLIIRVKRI